MAWHITLDEDTYQEAREAFAWDQIPADYNIVLCRIARRSLISAFSLDQPSIGNRYTAVDSTDI